MPKVDILMPVRNAAPFLAAAVHSVARQDLADWRLIAVDDGSDDGSWELLRDLARRDDRICPLRNPGSGIVAALNRALEGSSAPFLARMDADDLSVPSRLSRLCRLLEDHPETGVAGSLVEFFPRSALTPNMERYLAWQNSLTTHREIRRERYVESTLTHATAMFRRGVLVNAGGWQAGPFPEDLDLWLRLHRSGVVFMKHPEVLYLWRDHGGRESRTSPRCSAEAFHRCRVHHLGAELRAAGKKSVAVLGPAQGRARWTKSLREEGFEALPFPWKGDLPVPAASGDADFVLAIFGVPDIRQRAREHLDRIVSEDRDYLFAG